MAESLPKSSNGAKENYEMTGEKLLTEIWHNFTRSGRRNFQPFENFYFNMKGPIGCFGTLFCEELAKFFFLKVAELFVATCRKPGLNWQKWLTKNN